MSYSFKMSAWTSNSFHSYTTSMPLKYLFITFLTPSNSWFSVFFFQAEDGIRDRDVTGVQTCALPICDTRSSRVSPGRPRSVVVPSHSYAETEVARGELVRPHRRQLDRCTLQLRRHPVQLVHGHPEQIGRASCRERGAGAVVAGAANTT